MADFLIQATLSNLLVSTSLAVVAWVVQQRVHSASLVNLLWAIVVIKMVTPPLFSLPVVEVPRVSSSSVQPTVLSSELPRTYTTDPISAAAELTHAESPTSHTASQTNSISFWSRSAALTIFAWIAVSAMLFFVSAFRIMRFHWLLRANSRVHHDLSSGLSADVARQLGLRRNPDIVVATANIAPFVWWTAGRPIIVVSEQAIRQLEENDLRLVITYEMAHIKRRDHWFRWLEWFALTGLWWNPVMWWARAQLRISEEMACDDLVLETTHLEVHQYANALLNTAELLTSPAIRPPVVASAINGGGNLETRLKMMIAEKTWKVPAALRSGIVAMAFFVFPLGLVYAQDFKAVERRLGGAVEAGELTLEQARIMMETLKRSAGSEHAHDREMEAKKRRYMAFAKEIEAAVDAGKLSKEDAEKKLIAVRTEMFRGAGEKKARGDKNEDRDMEAKKRRYMAFAKEIEAAVDAGKLSKEDAEKKLIAVRMEMFRGAGEKKARSDKDEDRDMEAKKRRYMAFAKEIEAAVDAGKLSKEDAEKKLIAVRTEMFRGAGEKKARSDKDEDRDMEAKKRRYMAFAKEIEAAVDAGKLSKEDAEKKLIAVRTEMFRGAGEKKARSDKDEDRDMEAKKRRYMAFAKEIEAAVDAGKLSKEDAEKKLIAVRMEMFRDAGEKKARGDKSEDREMEARKRRYEQAAKRIKAAVKRGDVSAEEGEKKFMEIRKEIFGDRD